MANNKRNQGFYASDENWDKNTNRYNDSYRQQSNYDANQMDLDRDGTLGDTGGFYGGTNYMGASGIDYGQDWNNQNRKQHDRNYQEYQGYGYQSKSDYNQNFSQQGNTSNQPYNQQQYNRNSQQRRQDYNQQYNDYDDRRQRQNDRYRQGSNQHRGEEHPLYYGSVAGFKAIDDDVTDQQHHSNYGYQNRGWNDYNQQSHRQEYSNMNQHRNSGRNDERNWWDKTKDEVSSWFGDANAERRRRQDERHQGEFKGRGPKEYRRSDDRIREDVCDRLSEDSYIDASDIEVQVSNGEVTLNGKVDNRNTKRRAEDIIEAISGVSHVQNNLRVGQSMPASSTNFNSSNNNIRTDETLNRNK